MRWDIDCKASPIKDSEKSVLIQAAHSAVMLSNHDSLTAHKKLEPGKEKDAEK